MKEFLYAAVMLYSIVYMCDASCRKKNCELRCVEFCTHTCNHIYSYGSEQILDFFQQTHACD